MRIGVGLSIPELATRGGRAFSPASLFTSGVAGAWYDPSDVLLNWRTNLLTYSQEFDNAIWTKNNVTVTANTTTAPNGTTTADTAIISAATAASNLAQSITLPANTTATISCYAKFAGVQYLNMGYAYTNPVYAGYQFDLVNGVVVGGAASNGTNVSASITPVGDGWYRCVAVLILNFANPSPAFLPSNVAYTSGNAWYNLSLTGNGTDGIYIWGAQLELGSTATTYQAITTPEQTYLTYDPQPVLYQDSAGTTPVTAVEQPVGLMLDKSQGLVLGSELVTNGDFSGGTGWSTGGVWVISGGAASITSSTTSLSQSTLAAVVGTWYQVTFTISAFTAGGVRVEFGGVNGVSRTAAGTYTQYILATSTSFLVISPVATSTLSIDNVSIKVISGNHASQATAASRPILRARYNSLLYSETFSNAAWQSASSGTAAAGVKTPNFGTAPDGTQTACRIQLDVSAGSTGNQSQIYQNYACVVGNLTYQCYVKTNDGSTKTIQPFTATGAVLTVTGTWQLFTFTRNSASATDNFQFILIKGTTSDTADLLVWHPQSNPGSSAGTYQRIAAATDYATAGFLPYLALSTDDSFGTNSIDFTATAKMSVCAGVTKLNDAAIGVVVETGANYTNAGAFGVFAPDAAASARYSFGMTGATGAQNDSTPANYAAPVTSVLQSSMDISVLGYAGMSVRINAASVTLTNSGAGVLTTGTFGNYPLYIGRRANASLPFEGRIYQMVICGKTLSASELASTEAYVNSKTGAY